MKIRVSRSTAGPTIRPLVLRASHGSVRRPSSGLWRTDSLLDESREVRIGIDIGGTETLVMAIDARGKILDSMSFDTPVGGADMVASFTESIRSMCEDAAIIGIGIGTAGVVSEDGE